MRDLPSYRVPDPSVTAFHDAKRHERRIGFAALPEALRLMFVRRAARTTVGKLVTAAMIVVGAVALLELPTASYDVPPSQYASGLLLAIWPLFFVAYGLARIRATRRLDALIADDVRASDDYDADFTRWCATTPRQIVATATDALEEPSIAWPLLGATLLLPLSLHYCAALLIGVGNGNNGAAASFDWWIQVSIPITVVAHTVLSFQIRKFARAIRGSDTTEIRWISVQPALGWTCIGGLVPGALLYLIPPLLIMATAVLVIPMSLMRMRGCVIDERRNLAVLGKLLDGSASRDAFAGST